MSFIFWGWPGGGLISKRLLWNQISHASLAPPLDPQYINCFPLFAMYLLESPHSPGSSQGSMWLFPWWWVVGNIGASSRCHGCGECCPPPPFLCTSSPYTLLAPVRYLGEIATLGNPQKESKRPFFSLSALPRPPKEPASISPVSEDDGGEG